MAETRTRMSGPQRRDQVLEVAIAEFSLYGLHGGSTERIAQRAGISQPYVFRLFGTKKDLFLAACHLVCDRILATWEAVDTDQPTSTERLAALGEAYVGLMARRDELLLLLQSYAASKDPDVQAAVRQRMQQLYHYVEGVSAGSNEEVQSFFAQGMLLTVAAGLNLTAVEEEQGWARKFLGFTARP